jgi:hypothetical protein
MNTLLDLIGALLYIVVFPIIVLVNCCIELIVALKYVKTSAGKTFFNITRQICALPPALKHKLHLAKLIPWRVFHR